MIYFFFILDGAITNDLPLCAFENIKKKRQEYEDRERAMRQCADLNNKGIAFEKSGDIDSAIKVYEENIAFGHPAHYSFNRLAILYRKLRRNEDERRIILRALEVFPNDKFYADRLAKLEAKIAVQ